MSTVPTTAPAARRNRNRIEATYVWMLVPAFVLFTALLVVPFLTGLFYTFTNFKGYGSWHMIGLTNYKSLF